MLHPTAVLLGLQFDSDPIARTLWSIVKEKNSDYCSCKTVTIYYHACQSISLSTEVGEKDFNKLRGVQESMQSSHNRLLYADSF